LGALAVSALYRGVVVTPIGCDAYLLYLPGLAFFPLLALQVPLAAARSKLARLSLLAGLLLSFVWLMPFRFSFPKGGASARVLSLNIQAYHTDLPSALERILEREPDFICFQEVWTKSQFQVIEDGLAAYELYGHPEDEEYLGTHFKYGTFVAVERSWKRRHLPSPRDTAMVRVEKDGRWLLVVSLHGRKSHDVSPLGVLRTAEMQKQQAEELIGFASRARAPVVVAGDFNAPDSGPAFKVLRRLDSAFSQAGRGFALTFPASFPIVRIDHILASESVFFSDFATFDAGSDHLGVVADFGFDDQ